ncbi:MAG: glycosyltransferase family 4 protein [Devosia sp.]
MSLPPAPHRILMTVDAVGGVWRYAMDLGTALVSRGHELVFAVFGPPASAAQVAEAQRVGEVVHADAPLDWIVTDEAELAPVAGRIAELAARHGADLLHLNLPSQAAGLDTDLPVVVVSHSCVVTWFQAVRGTPVPEGWSWQHRLNRDGFANTDLVVAPSQSHADLLAQCYGPSPKLRVVHNATTPIRSDSVREPFILAAGRWWDEGKNAAVLEAAAAGTDWPIRLCGPQRGPSGQYMPLQHTQYLGEVPNGELRALMARAGSFVSPSLYEPFGLAPLEAASAGTPLVLADLPTYRELWDGAALLVPARDPAAFRAALNTLAGNPVLRADLGRRAGEHSKLYSLDAQADRMTGLYREAAGQTLKLSA